ncbi:MAG: aminotransferase class IV family protein, partial [Candidatus Pacebacteria bacterium]|nr:aminotransferase class IV family protein [Candidatus Paceibacterota bacterium]
TKVAKQLLAKNNLNKKDASLRLIMTGGESMNGMTVGGKNTLAILVEGSYNLPDQVFKTGGKLITVDYARYFPQAKTTSYLLAVQLQPQKIKAGAVEILYVNEDKVLEASTSNFFLVKNKTLITAKAGVLPGITREAVIKLAKKAGYKVEEREVKMAELKSADEAFITATNKDVCPIVKIDQLEIGNGQVGEVTKELLTKYRALIS